MTEMLKTSETTEKLLKFIDASPSCFHAVKNIMCNVGRCGLHSPA